MIIFGTRTSSYRPYNNTAFDCDHCGSKASVDIFFATRYFHIFWIPVFPFSKTGMSQCQHCKRAQYRGQMSAQMQTCHDDARGRAKTPVRYFTGLILVVLFFTLAFFAAFIGRQNSQSWIQSPKAGDVYEVSETEGYTLYKVTQVTPDSLTLIPYEYIVERTSQLRKLKRSSPDNYDESAAFTLSAKAIREMYAARSIRSVDRK